MLHAALIGFPSTGKSTLFQLMTSSKDAPRGKGDTVVGISKVPDARLDRLTALFNPKKRVPATSSRWSRSLKPTRVTPCAMLRHRSCSSVCASRIRSSACQ